MFQYSSRVMELLHVNLDLKSEFSACMLVFPPLHRTGPRMGLSSHRSEGVPRTEDGSSQEAVTWATVILRWNARQRLDLIRL